MLHDIKLPYLSTNTNTAQRRRKEPGFIDIGWHIFYTAKSNNFYFQICFYSIHEGGPPINPMVIMTTTGYFVSILGPYT